MRGSVVRKLAFRSSSKRQLANTQSSKRKRQPIKTASWRVLWILLLFVPTAEATDLTINNEHMSVRARQEDGSYEIRAKNGEQPAIRSRIAAMIDHRWVISNKYPNHRMIGSSFHDVLGDGRQITVTFTGLPGSPNLSYILRLYDRLPFGEIEVRVDNGTSKAMSVQSIRSLEALGSSLLNLGAEESSERVLSDSFSENSVQISDLGDAPDGTHMAVGSQLIYNRDSKLSLFFGALTSKRFVTMLRLHLDKLQKHSISSYTVDSTGTTEARSQAPWFRSLPAEERIQLSLPLAPRETIASERLMFSLGNDYHSQLESYGSAIRELYHARVTGENLMGWWSWTSYYMTINERDAYTNALWMAQHLKSSGYNFFHIDEGYEYSRGQYTTVKAAAFPHGMRRLNAKLSSLGLKFGIWVAPLMVGERSWVFQNHKAWLVRDEHGRPLWFYGSRDHEHFFVLDATHPRAREYLRNTFQTLVKEWGVCYIKLDFMDLTAVEGNYYRPHTTALEAQRIALQTIRHVVGKDVLLDKDGSPMLNPVGIVDEGRISGDTKHSFRGWKTTAVGLFARYYMNRNFFVSDPDAFTLQREIPTAQIEVDNGDPVPLSFDEAEMSIALAALSGGMFEIGDDLPTLASEPERLSLLTNPGLLQIEKLGRAAKPLDLLDYSPDDLQPSISFLREDKRQYVLAVFNWTDEPRAHVLNLTDLGLDKRHVYDLYDVLNENKPFPLDGDALSLRDQAPHSVKLIKIVDASLSPSSPAIVVNLPKNVRAGESARFCATDAPDGVPGLGYHWNFGDGITVDGASPTHKYTLPGNYTVQLEVEGLDGLSTLRTFPIAVGGLSGQRSLRRGSSIRRSK